MPRLRACALPTVSAAVAAAGVAAASALAVLFPVECAGCGTEDVALCGSCRVACAPVVSEHRLRDGTPVFAALRYESVVRSSVLALKEHNRTDLARALGIALSAAIERAEETASAAAIEMAAEGATRVAIQPSRRVEITLVPSSSAARRRRGYDPVRLLVSRAGFVSTRVLEPVRSGAVQKSLSVADRALNRQGSMRSRVPLNSRTFVVVDDVLTSGATAGEAVRAIREAGGEVIAVAVLAFTPRLFTENSFR